MPVWLGQRAPFKQILSSGMIAWPVRNSITVTSFAWQSWLWNRQYPKANWKFLNDNGAFDVSEVKAVRYSSVGKPLEAMMTECRMGDVPDYHARI